MVSILLVSLAIICMCVRLPQLDGMQNRAVLAAAAFTMSDGKYKVVNSQNNSSEVQNSNNQTTNVENTTQQATQAATQSTNHDGQKKYSIVETQYGAGGTQYENFFVKNKTAYNLNIGELLKEPLGFEMENSRKVQVLIMHTHTCESYMDSDQGFYWEDFYPRTTDCSKNISQVGETIAQSLKDAGIGVIHDSTIHDSPSYNGAYYRSYDTIENYIKKYPDIKVVLDIHRDSIGTGENNGKIKPTFTYNGKKAAQIMIMAGYDPDGSQDFPDWNYNLRFALRIQQKAETLYPGITRPMDFGEFVYNMNVNTGSLLIEIGTDANTLDEAKYTGQLLGNALAQVLQGK